MSTAQALTEIHHDIFGATICICIFLFGILHMLCEILKELRRDK